MRIIRTTLFCLLITFGLSAQDPGEIKGKVTDAITGEPAFLVNVWVDAGGRLVGTQTDMDGRFTIKPLESGTYNVTAYSLQYDTLQVQNVRVTPGKITFLNDLTMSFNTLQTFSFYDWEEPLIEKDNPAVMRILDTELMERADSRNTVRMIESKLPGIKATDDGRQLYFRGARPQNMVTFIDGVKLMDSFIPRLPRGAIKSISVYTGGIPAKYGDITGGVVVIETKSYMDLWNQSQAEKRKETALY